MNIIKKTKKMKNIIYIILLSLLILFLQIIINALLSNIIMNGIYKTSFYNNQSLELFVNDIPKDVQEEIDKKNEEKKDLENKAQELQGSIQMQQSKSSDINHDLTKTLSEVIQLQNKIMESNLQISILNIEINNLEIAMNNQKDRIKVAEAKVKEKEEIIKKRINIVYTNGRYKNWDIILSSNNIMDAFINFQMVKRVNEIDKDALISFKNDRNELKKVSDKIRSQELQIYNKGLEVKKIQEVNSNYIIIKNSKMKVLTQEQKDVAENISKLESEKLELEKEMARHAQSYPKIANYIGGEMAWPVIGHRRISAGYLGYPGHKAIDITGGGSIGAPIVAANHGRVVYAKSLTYSYGKHVLIDHGGGIYTLYAHMSKLEVKAGDYVDRGQEIGKLGSTGNSTGPHLHFEVRLGGPYYSNRVNPMPYVTNKKSPNENTKDTPENNGFKPIKPVTDSNKVESDIVL